MLLRLVLFTLGHLGAWYAMAHLAFGTDFDRMPDRSIVAAAGAHVFAVLQYPHDLILRLLPPQLLEQAPQAALVVIGLNSLLWGTALTLAWQLLVKRKALRPAVVAQ